MFRRDRKAREDLVKTIRGELAQALNRGGEEGYEFILDDDIYGVWNSTRLQILSKGLDWEDTGWQARVLADYKKVLSILVWIHWDEWEHFKKIFLDHVNSNRQPDRTDEDLPFVADPHFLRQSQRHEFLSRQYIFIPVVLAEESQYDNTDAEYNKQHRMPFLISEIIGEGATGLVRKELVAAKHFQRGDSLNTTPVWVASKYIQRGATTGQNNRSFSAEQKALRSFKQCLEKHENIMHSYTTFTHGSYFAIISPLADLDLRRFLEGDYPDFNERQCRFTPLDLLREASCLAGALNFLHHRLKLREKKIACAHLDFKPDNVLVKWSVDSQRTPAGQWLVHDFGTARIKEPSEEANALAPGDFLTHFSLTKAQRTPGPFQAPEVQPSEEKVVGRESDMWSFGCLLAVVEAFALGGPRYVDDLGRSRYNGNQPNQTVTDYFYTTVDGKAIVKPTITGFLESLKTETREGAWIGRTLGLVFRMLVDTPTKRLTAQDAQDQLDIVIGEEERYLSRKCGWVEPEVSLGENSVSLPFREHGGLQHLESPPQFREMNADTMSTRWSTNTDIPGPDATPSPFDPGSNPFFPSQYSPQHASLDRQQSLQDRPTATPTRSPFSPYGYSEPSPRQVSESSRNTNGQGGSSSRGLGLTSTNGRPAAHLGQNPGSSGITNGAPAAYQFSESYRNMNAHTTPTYLQAPAAPGSGDGQSQAPSGQPLGQSRNSSLTPSRNPSIIRSDTQGFQVLSPATTLPTSPEQTNRSDESSSLGTGSSLSPDVSFVHLMSPHKALKSMVCPKRHRVASLSKTLVLVPNFSLQNNWAPKRPPKSPDRISTGFAVPQNIQCPPGFEWDMMSLCSDHIVLRAQNGVQSKFFRYLCHSRFDYGHNLEIWSEDAFSTSMSGASAPIAINGMANYVVDVNVNYCGDTLFILDEGLCYYSSGLGLHTLETEGQLRKACFSTDGQYVFAWTLVRDPSGRQDNRWYIWQASTSAQIMNQPTRRKAAPRPGSGRDGLIFPLARSFAAFEIPNRLYIIGKDANQSQVIQLNTPIDDIIAGGGYENTENQSQGLVLIQQSVPPRLINLPLLADVRASAPSKPQKLKEGYNTDTHDVAVVIEDQVTFVVVSHPSGLIERRKMLI